MGKTIRYDAVEVVIRVPTTAGGHTRFTSGGPVSEKWEEGSAQSITAAQRRADEIEKAIKRSLGPYEDECRDPETRVISEAVCSHCGYAWGEKDTKYNGGCCDADEAGNPENQAA